MYNRYACRCDKFCRTDLRYEPRRDSGGCGPPRRAQHQNSFFGKHNPLSPLLGLVPEGLDIGDLLLFAILLLMYLESGDEECLIILAVLFLMK
jgi:hypothetical protein